MIHCFKIKDEHIALDIASGAVHALDALAYELCKRISGYDQNPLALGQNCPDTLLHELSEKFSHEDIVEAYAELHELYTEGLLFSEDIVPDAALIKDGEMPIKALCLHVSHDCNLRCKYCFAQTGDFGMKRSIMSPETARTAIDFVIENSKSRRNIEIDFFGGEPLMGWDAVKAAVEYAREKERETDKLFRFTVTTNGVLLDDDKIDYINRHMSNAVLSADGRRCVNDAMRPSISGLGSFDIVMPRFKKLVEAREKDKDYYIRGTFTAKNLDFTNDVLSLYEQGFDQISVEPVLAPDGAGFELKTEHLAQIRSEYEALAEKMLQLESKGESFNFFHFNVDLEQGPCIIKRLRGCGAGCEYVAVTPEGDIYPCHQFVGENKFKMGNIVTGELDRSKAKEFSSVSVYTCPDCRGCWARFYCSGGCSAANYFSNSDMNKSYQLGCELEKMRLECALYLAVKRM